MIVIKTKAMKKIALLTLILLFVVIGCEKPEVPTPFSGKTFTTSEETPPITSTPGTGLDTFMIQVFRDINSPCFVAQNAPAEVGIGIDWFFLGQFTTVGVFAWSFDEFTVCEDSIRFEGNELFVYINDGEGRVADMGITQLPGSAPYTVDTIFRTSIFPNSTSYQNDTVKLGYKFYNYTNDIKLSVDSILVVKNPLGS